MLSRQFLFIRLFNFPTKIAMNDKKLTRFEKNEKLSSEALSSFIRNSITIVNDECLLIFLSAFLYKKFLYPDIILERKKAQNEEWFSKRKIPKWTSACSASKEGREMARKKHSNFAQYFRVVTPHTYILKDHHHQPNRVEVRLLLKRW